MMRLSIGLLALALSGCYSAGIYGYDRTYVPLDDEEDLLERSTVPPYRDVRRDPRDFSNALVTWFGVVSSTEPQPGGKVMVHLSHRIHQDRHLCADMERDTCRVTVSERSEGVFSALVTVHPEDVSGVNRLQTGSLVRVYGKVTGAYDAEGGPVVEARLYRHWPRGQYLTTAARGQMRR